MGGRGAGGRNAPGGEPGISRDWSVNAVGRLQSGNEAGLTVAQEYRRKEIEGKYSPNDYARAAEYGQTPREYQASITEDIRAKGMINPVTSSYGNLDEGYHRYAAMRQLGQSTMRVRDDSY